MTLIRPGPLTLDPGDPTDPGAIPVNALLPIPACPVAEPTIEEVGIPIPSVLVPEEPDSVPLPVNVESTVNVVWP